MTSKNLLFPENPTDYFMSRNILADCIRQQKTVFSIQFHSLVYLGVILLICPWGEPQGAFGRLWEILITKCFVAPMVANHIKRKYAVKQVVLSTQLFILGCWQQLLTSVLRFIVVLPDGSATICV